MTTKHTPGPWSFEECGADPSVYKLMSEDGGVIGFPVRGTGGKSQRKEFEANARLIAAAPDLLEALDYLLAQTVDQDLEYGIALTEGELEAREKALAAIANATGSAA